MAFAFSVPGSILIGQLWWYSFSVLRPAQVLKAAGMYPANELGRRPSRNGRKGAGRYFSKKLRAPVYLDKAPVNYKSVATFDDIARVYGTFVEPFTGPVFEETIKYLRGHLPVTARILDCSCGPGTETLRLASLFPEGEVVGMDLSADMVTIASTNAERSSLRNVAFFQADVDTMPADFKAQFDAVYCSFAFHHYAHPARAVREMHRVLRPRGRVFVVDPGPAWMKLLASPWAKWADPGWVGFHTGDEFRALFKRAGYSGFYWTETLPGVGLTIATK